MKIEKTTENSSTATGKDKESLKPEESSYINQNVVNHQDDKQKSDKSSSKLPEDVINEKEDLSSQEFINSVEMLANKNKFLQTENKNLKHETKTLQTNVVMLNKNIFELQQEILKLRKDCIEEINSMRNDTIVNVLKKFIEIKHCLEQSISIFDNATEEMEMLQSKTHLALFQGLKAGIKLTDELFETTLLRYDIMKIDVGSGDKVNSSLHKVVAVHPTNNINYDQLVYKVILTGYKFVNKSTALIESEVVAFKFDQA